MFPETIFDDVVDWKTIQSDSSEQSNSFFRLSGDAPFIIEPPWWLSLSSNLREKNNTFQIQKQFDIGKYSRVYLHKASSWYFHSASSKTAVRIVMIQRCWVNNQWFGQFANRSIAWRIFEIDFGIVESKERIIRWSRSNEHGWCGWSRC